MESKLRKTIQKRKWHKKKNSKEVYETHITITGAIVQSIIKTINIVIWFKKCH